MSIVAPQPGEIVVDATVGHGGHARLVAEAIGQTGRLIGLDVDAYNLSRARSGSGQRGYAPGDRTSTSCGRISAS